MIFSTTQWLHEDIIIKLPFNNMGGWTVQSRCVFCKNLERNLVSKLWTGKIQPSRSLHTHICIYLWLCTWVGLRELNMHINNEHDRHIVLIKSWQRNYENSYHLLVTKYECISRGTTNGTLQRIKHFHDLRALQLQ